MQKESKIKVVFYGDAACAHTGFGVANSNLIQYLLKTGKYEIHHLGINYYGDPVQEQKWNDYYLYPMQGDPYGKNRLLPLLLSVQPEILFTLNDFDAVLHIPQALKAYKDKTGKKIKWSLWFPVDGEPMYPEFINFMKSYVDDPVVISKYGKQVMQTTDPTFECDQIYHGIDMSVFHRISAADIKKNKEVLGDKFIILMVGVNQLRKNYAEAIKTFAEFAKDKDDVLLFLHTQKSFPMGWDLEKVCRLYGVTNKVVFTEGISGPRGIDAASLNTIYNIADVYMTLSLGEGFQIPNIEAMLVGTPIIYHDVTSISELIGDAGIPVKSRDTLIFPKQDRELVRPLPFLQDALDGLNKLYSDKEYRVEMGKKAMERVKNLIKSGDLDWDVVGKKFDERFEKLLIDKSEELDLEEIL